MNDGLTLRIFPDPLWVQPNRGRQRLHFDLALGNETGKAWLLRGVELLVLVSDGQLVARRFLDENGIQPGIATLPERRLSPGGVLHVFNPFPDFSDTLPLPEMRLRVRLLLTGPEDGQAVVEGAVRPRRYRQRVALQLPLAGRLLVDDGHDFYAHHRRIPLMDPVTRQLGIEANNQRYAWDFVIIDAAGRPRPMEDAAVEGFYRFDPPRTRNEDYFVFGAPVLAPAAGRVAACRGDLPDETPWRPRYGLEDYRADPSLMFGNYVVLDHGHAEFSLLAHCQAGSVQVTPGDSVSAGETIARAGNSGNTYYPHLHYQLMTSPDVRTAEGLPACFSSFTLCLGDRKVGVSYGAPDTGEVIERQ